MDVTHVCVIIRKSHTIFFLLLGSVISQWCDKTKCPFWAQWFIHYEKKSKEWDVSSHFCSVFILTLSIFSSFSCFFMVSTIRKRFCRRLCVYVVFCFCLGKKMLLICRCLPVFFCLPRSITFSLRVWACCWMWQETKDQLLYFGFLPSTQQ